MKSRFKRAHHPALATYTEAINSAFSDAAAATFDSWRRSASDMEVHRQKRARKAAADEVKVWQDQWILAQQAYQKLLKTSKRNELLVATATATFERQGGQIPQWWREQQKFAARKALELVQQQMGEELDTYKEDGLCTDAERAAAPAARNQRPPVPFYDGVGSVPKGDARGSSKVRVPAFSAPATPPPPAVRAFSPEEETAAASLADLATGLHGEPTEVPIRSAA